MMRTRAFHSCALVGVLVLLAFGVSACSTKEARYPTQPPARDLNVPETTVVAAAFTVTTGSGLTVVFTDESTGNVDVYRWNFGDGRTSSARNPVHTYSSAGEYAVTLTVSNAISSDSASQLVTVGGTEEAG